MHIQEIGSTVCPIISPLPATDCLPTKGSTAGFTKDVTIHTQVLWLSLEAEDLNRAINGKTEQQLLLQLDVEEQQQEETAEKTLEM